MANFPFELVVDSMQPHERTVSVRCVSCLRSVKGRRKVYDAIWDGRPVVAKVFDRRFASGRHVRKEWNGLRELQQRGLDAPKPLLRGRTKDGRSAILLEKLLQTSTLLDVLNEASDAEAKLKLLILFTRVLAEQHRQGVVQEDLHLGNFLYDGQTIYAIDPWRMRFLSGELDRDRSISYLALFVRYLPSHDSDSMVDICREYFRARGWKMEQADRQLFERKLVFHQKRTVKKSLRKCLRTSKRYIRMEAGEFKGIFAKSFCEGGGAEDFMSRIDDLMDAGEIFKKGNTCYVSRVRWNNQDVVIKRYNHKGLFHSLRHSFVRSRACQGWLHGHHLEMLQIATPRPVACVEQYRGRILWQSNLITEYVAGRKLYSYMSDSSTTKEQGQAAIEEVMHLLDDLDRYRISHGDLKHTNILLTENGPVLMDLDGMRFHRLGWTYKRRRAKDMAHFAGGGRGSYDIADVIGHTSLDIEHLSDSKRQPIAPP